MVWYPHSTVATIVERDKRFLMVEEKDQGRRVFNQPAGHLEAGESLLQAACRETLEETGWHVRLQSLLGLYHYQTASGETYIRHCFIAEALQQEASPNLDPDIIAVHWLSAKEILAPDFPCRSPAVQKVMTDYLDGIRHPLDLIFHHRE